MFDTTNNYFSSNFNDVTYYKKDNSNFILGFTYHNFNPVKIVSLYKIVVNDPYHIPNTTEYRYLKIHSTNLTHYKILPLEKENNKIGYIGLDTSVRQNNASILTVLKVNNYTNDKIIYTTVPYVVNNNFFENGRLAENYMTTTNFLISLDNNMNNKLVGAVVVDYTPFLISLKIKKIQIFSSNKINSIDNFITNK